MTHWYRVYESHWNEDPEQKLVVAGLPVVGETEKTVVVNYFGQRKRVLKDARKRFAYPTIELAIEGYIARKARHIRILEHQIMRAKEGHDAAVMLQQGIATVELPVPVSQGATFSRVRFPAPLGLLQWPLS